MLLRQEEPLALSLILSPLPLPPTSSRRLPKDSKRISAKKYYEKHKIKIRTRDVEKKKKKWNKKTEDEKKIQRKNGRVTQMAYRSRQSSEKKEAMRVASKERMKRQR